MYNIEFVIVFHYIIDTFKSNIWKALCKYIAWNELSYLQSSVQSPKCSIKLTARPLS